MWVRVNEGLSDARSHGKVGDGGDAADEEVGDVQGAVTVRGALRRDKEDDGAEGHEAKGAPQPCLAKLCHLFRAAWCCFCQLRCMRV